MDLALRLAGFALDGENSGEQVVQPALVRWQRSFENLRGLGQLSGVVQDPAQFEADIHRARFHAESLLQQAQAFRHLALFEEKYAVDDKRPVRGLCQLHRAAIGVGGILETAEGFIGEAQIFINPALPGAEFERAQERIYGWLKAVFIVKGTAEEIPGLTVGRVEHHSPIEELLRQLPLLPL